MSFGRLLDPILVEELNQLQLSARQVVDGSIVGSHRSPVRGASVEFREHRAYVPGDEPRRLDWRILARTDRPFVRQFDEETNLRAMMVLDTSGSMSYRSAQFSSMQMSKLEYASRFAAALAYLMLGQTESVGLKLSSDATGDWLAPRSGLAQLSGLIDRLEGASATGPAVFFPAVHEVAKRLGRRGLVILMSDLFCSPADLQDALSHLDHERHETVVLRFVDHDEIEFPFDKWTRFKGIEGENAKMCEPALMRSDYIQNFSAHREQLKDTCRRSRAEFHEIVTSQPLGAAIRRFMGLRETR